MSENDPDESDDSEPEQGQASAKPRNYEVGYCKPPKHGQIKPGEIRNPKGRGKARLNFQAELDRALRKTITITENGKRRRISTQDAIMKSLSLKAVKGGDRAQTTMINLMRQRDQDVAESEAKDISANDQRIIADALERLMRGGGSDEE